MPARPPPIGDAIAAQLARWGASIRVHRKRHKVSAVNAAEAAGMSRVTWHRIERGEPSVTIGAYLGALSAMGLALQMVDPQQAAPHRPAQPELPRRIAVDRYPQLQSLAWQQQGATELTPAEALGLYERNWRHIDRDALTAAERELVQLLATRLGGGTLLV